jgi:hypothetical protein
MGVYRVGKDLNDYNCAPLRLIGHAHKAIPIA